MSGAPSILCSICTENFQTSDTIYTTSCGHVLHYNCIQNWRERSTECPVCRVQYGNIQKLFLNFDENAGGESVMNDLQAKLDSYKTGMEKLNDQLSETELSFLQLNEHFTIAQEEINLLKGELSKRNDSESNFMALQKQYTEVEENVKKLEAKNQDLFSQIEAKTKENQLKTLEISTLKDTMGCMGTSAIGSDSILKQQLKIMEQKLRHITGELQKEISISTQLSIDKMKLQSLVDQYGAAQTEPSPNFVNNIQEQKPVEKKNPKPNEKETITNDSTHLTSVVIKRFPSRHISYPLIDVIVALASAIQVQLSPCDICDARILENRSKNHPLPNVVSLFVKFQSLQLKTTFLSSKSKVKNHPEYGSILIYPYMDDDTNSLFHYAKSKLKVCGFVNVFCQNGQVMASKGRNRRAKLIHIKSRDQVDDMLSSNAESITENTAKGIVMLQCFTDRNKSNSSMEGKEASKDESDLKHDEDFYARN
uniref:RING-type domain-containing protein n=1 Tax=Glossina morsitans morsitans TaxID=37546 RepID=A0A1B0FJH6_GLOMM